jgi:hypothetical protein
MATGYHLSDYPGRGIWIDFFLPTQVAALLGTKVGFTASVVTAIPGLPPCLVPGLFLVIPIRPVKDATLLH